MPTRLHQPSNQWENSPVLKSRLTRHVAGPLLGLLLVLQPVTALGATTVTYGVSGAEVYATATRGVFVGVGWAADDYATWKAVVDHTPFDADRNAVITGGSFSLDGLKRDATGTFTSGSVTLTWAAPGCGNETFSVVGSFAIAGGGDGDFKATLKHYRTSIWGRCVTYAATVSGSVALHLP
jgi:hypothetical protein